MYLPAALQSSDPSVAAALMREHPFASLISCDDDGLPYVTHLPLHLREDPVDTATGADTGTDSAPRWTLLGHCARANPHWRYLQARPTAVVTFLGPHAYISPSVYPDLQRVPTWNYLAVHCKVQARLVDDEEGKDHLLKQLIGDHELPYAEQWRGLSEAYTQRMLSAIVAFELKVVDWQCKIKVNQARPESHAALRERHGQGSDNERGLVRWMDRLGV